jgi:peroxiredoxin Q/BCP
VTTDGSEVGLADFRGTKLVLYFYPMDFTPGCTAQACSLRDHNAAIQAKGAKNPRSLYAGCGLP